MDDTRSTFVGWPCMTTCASRRLCRRRRGSRRASIRRRSRSSGSPAAVDAPAVSYLLNLAVANEVGIDAENVRGVLAAIPPIVGTARVGLATGKIVDALEVAIEIAEQDDQDE